jgi:small nuclear ribonucleoprotein (snRNP)-like protein
MATDSGSRHAPDLMAALSKRRQGQEAAGVDAPSDEQRREMEWLCSLIGCQSPYGAAATATDTAAPASAVAAVLPPPLLRVSLVDGRVYTGRLSCVDSHANLVLSGASQEAGVVGDGVRIGGFQIGNILVAWKLVAKVEQAQQTNNAQAA